MSHPLRIAILIPSLERQASVAYPLSLYEEFKKRGHSCDIFYFAEKDNSFDLPDAQKITLSTKLAWNSYEVIHSHGFIPDLFCFLHKPVRGKPLVISTLHGFFYSQFQQKYNSLLALLLALIWMFILLRHDLYAVFTNYAKKQYPLLKRSKMWVIPSGIPSFSTPSLPAEEQIIFDGLKSQGKTVLGIVSRLVRSKGIEQVLRVLPQIPSFHLIVIGEGPEHDTLTKLAQQLKVETQVSFFGYRPNGKIYMPQFDIFIMPSRTETFGFTLLEAAALEVPIICSNIPTFKEIFTSEEVTYFQLDDQNDLIQAINTSLTTKNIKPKKCKESFLKKYTVRHMADQYLQLYCIFF